MQSQTKVPTSTDAATNVANNINVLNINNNQESAPTMQGITGGTSMQTNTKTNSMTNQKTNLSINWTTQSRTLPHSQNARVPVVTHAVNVNNGFEGKMGEYCTNPKSKDKSDEN